MLCTEEINEKSRGIDTKSTLDILRIMNSEDASVAHAVGKVLPEIAALIDAVVAAFKKKGRLFYIGSGTSGRLGVLDASECPPTFGVPSGMVVGIIAGGDGALRTAIENAEDDANAARIDLSEHGFSSRDVLIGLSAAGNASYVKGALEHAKSIGATTGCIVCNKDSELAHLSDYPVSVIVGPELIQGSTRLKAGTAEKLILNMISTVSMVKLGLTYDNLMVNIQPTNNKLKERAKRIIREITGCTEDIASEYYQKSGYTVSCAVLMIMFGIGRDKAEEALCKAEFNLHKAMDSFLSQTH